MSTTVVFSLSETIQFCVIALSAGSLYAQVRSHGKRLDKQELKTEAIEFRMIAALDSLGKSMSDLTLELKLVMTDFAARLKNVENDNQQNGGTGRF